MFTMNFKNKIELSIAKYMYCAVPPIRLAKNAAHSSAAMIQLAAKHGGDGALLSSIHHGNSGNPKIMTLEIPE